MGSRFALKAAWFATFFPTLILYSAIIMREVYIIFFLTYALISCVQYIDESKFNYFLKSFFGFFMASLFHGPIILGLFIFIVYVFFLTLKQNNYFLRFKKNLYLLFILPLILIPIVTYFLGYYSIPKIGNFTNLGNLKADDQSKVSGLKDRLIWKMDKAQKQCASWKKYDASYPSWIVPKDTVEIIYLTPVRMFYFYTLLFHGILKKLFI